MTGSDLIVLAPWLVFAVGLAVVCLLLVRSTRAAGPRRSLRVRRSRRARRSRRRHDPQEEQCSEKNAEARTR
jgi:heme exporter protein D